MADADDLKSFGWMGSFRESYLPLDAGIVTFRDDTLAVSYGKDTAQARAKVRQVTRWDLRQIPAKQIAAPPKK